MSTVIGLIPAFLWGLIPILISKFVKGGSYVQAVGTSIGVTIVSIIMTLITRPALASPAAAALCFFSGFGWMVGQFGQFLCYEKIGVARTFPFSSGMQIIGSSLLGWLVLHEWSGTRQIVSGLICIAVIVAGIFICNDMSSSNEDGSEEEKKGGAGKWYLLLFVTTIGYWAYSLLPKLTTNTSSYSQSLPQAAGILCGALILTAVASKSSPFKLRHELILPASAVGLLYGVASFAFLVSITLNGMVKGFLLSQISMVIATASGIFILREKQTLPWWRIILGNAAIFLGCIATQFI